MAESGYHCMKTKASLGSLNAPHNNAGSQNLSSLLTIFTPWVIIGKTKFQRLL